MATPLRLASFGLFVVACCSSSLASVITVDLTGNTTQTTTTQQLLGGNITLTSKSLALIDTATGTNQLPGVTVSVGDTINGVISLNGSFSQGPSINSSPYTPQVYFPLWQLGSTINYIGYTESLTFENNGTPVSLPAGYSANFAGTGSIGLVAGVGGLSGNPGSTGAFSFTKILFSITINTMTNHSFQQITTGMLGNGTPNLSADYYTPPPPVPVPPSGWLMLSGLLALCCASRLGVRKSDGPA